jgi:hypothetical protein
MGSASLDTLPKLPKQRVLSSAFPTRVQNLQRHQPAKTLCTWMGQVPRFLANAWAQKCGGEIGKGEIKNGGVWDDTPQLRSMQSNNPRHPCSRDAVVSIFRWIRPPEQQVTPPLLLKEAMGDPSHGRSDRQGRPPALTERRLPTDPSSGVDRELDL